MYLDALGRGDGKACASLWTPDGDIVDDSGAVLPGRDTAAMSTVTVPAAQRPEVRVSETSLRFLTDDVAVEDGTIEIGPPGATTTLAGRFSATWVRHDGGWKLAALREARAAEPLGPAALMQLDWMVGDWVVDRKSAPDDATPAPHGAGQASIELSVRWNDTKTFLIREMKLMPTAGQPGAGLEISQRIGWDPLARRIRSWAFGSDGSHSEATWLRDGASWIARNTSVLPDGSQTTSINTYSYDGKDRCVWLSIPTRGGAEHMPPFSVTLVRVRKSGGDTP